jgi:hypothetical protein
MCRAWIAYITAERRTLWGISAEEWTALQSLFATAEEWLQKAQDVAERTHVVTVECGEAFRLLEDKMRDIKRRSFLVPPLTEGDLAALGLKSGDTTSTPAGAPTAQVMAETFLRGPGELGFRIVYVSGNPHDKANAGYRVWYRVVGPGETPPEKPEDLNKSFFTRRKRDFIEFDYADAGKTAYIAVQIESGSGKQGKYGPMVSAVVPGSK